MITKCDLSDKKRIISYIGNDYPSCLYLYLNLIKYGIGSDVIDVFIQQDGDLITAVMLKYYSCLHVFSRGDCFDAYELSAFFIDNNFTMLYCTENTAKKIYASFPESILSKAVITTGWVAQIKSVDKEPRGLAVSAQQDDFVQIVRMILNDKDIGRSYKFDELSSQIESRNKEGYARNLVIKKDDVVIAHACTNAELGNIAVVAELLVREEYRRQGYASERWRDLCSRLLYEGKEVFSFYYSEESRRLHRKIGFFEVCEWAKVVITGGTT